MTVALPNQQEAYERKNSAASDAADHIFDSPKKSSYGNL